MYIYLYNNHAINTVGKPSNNITSIFHLWLTNLKWDENGHPGKDHRRTAIQLDDPVIMEMLSHNLKSMDISLPLCLRLWYKCLELKISQPTTQRGTHLIINPFTILAFKIGLNLIFAVTPPWIFCEPFVALWKLN